MFHRHGSVSQYFWRATRRRAPDRAAGGVRDEFDAGLFLALVQPGQLLPPLPYARITACDGHVRFGDA